MTVPLHHLPLPSGGEAVLRAPTVGDLEVVGVELHKLVPRCLQSIDGRATPPGGLRFTDYNAVAGYVEGLLNPTVGDVNATQRVPRRHEVLVTLPDGRTALIDEPTFDVYQSSTDYGRAGVQGGIRLLRRCLREVGGKPIDYATLAAAWPFSAPETLLLHMELVRLCTEPADAARAREGKVRVVG